MISSPQQQSPRRKGKDEDEGSIEGKSWRSSRQLSQLVIAVGAIALIFIVGFALYANPGESSPAENVPPTLQRNEALLRGNNDAATV